MAELVPRPAGAGAGPGPGPAGSAAGPGPAADAAPVAAPWLWLGAIVLLAALLRFPTLGGQSIWFDEAATWDLMRLPFGEMISALPHRESNPPLFYTLEWLWGRAFGDGAFGLRGLSALAGTLTVPVAYGIGRRLGGTRAGLATAALVAVNPLLVWFSQEARSYELVVLLSSCALLAFVRTFDDERPRALAWWALAAALALATHYFAMFVLAPQAAWLLWRHPRRRDALLAVGAVVVVLAALLPMLLAQRGNPYDIAGESIALRMVQIPKQFLMGYRGPLALPAGLVAAALTVAGVWLLARWSDRVVRERTLLVGAVGLLGLLLPIAGAAVGFDYLNARNVIPALVPLATVMGVGLGAARPPQGRWVGAALAAALCAISLGVVITVASDQEYQRPDWKGLAAAIGRSDELRAIVVSPANGEPPLRYYRRALTRLPDSGTHVREVDVVGVAGSNRPGVAPRLPAQVGTQFQTGSFRLVQRIATDSYVIQRYRQPDAGLVQPAQVASIRFSDYPPLVATLAAGR